MTTHEAPERRRFLGAAVAMLAGHAGRTHPDTSPVARRPTPAAAADTAAAASRALGTPKQIAAGLLDVGYTDAGPADGRVAILLHGWPYDVHSFVEVVPLLVAAGFRVIVPHLRGFGPTRFLSSDTIRNGQQAALALDVIALMDALRIDKAVVAGFDWGARTADIVAALWPERCLGLVAVSGYLIANREANRRPLTPQAEYAWWYQYYFATDRGERGYSEHRREFARLIWRLASPAWQFDEATFERAACAFDNPDHVRIVIHNYRWRLGIDAGEPQYDAFEAALAKAPVISIPAITLQGDADGAPHPDSRAYAAKFAGRYAHRVVAGGVGHNLPQEAPLAFAQAVIDVARA
jgi:pimeloyl-ACP methyl ester carboxylesterase